MIDNHQSPFNSEPDSLQIDWKSLRHEHLVQWYDNDASLIQSVGPFLAASLKSGGAAINIATPSHRIAVDRWLMADGHHTVALQRAGRYIPLDAKETLDRFMVGDSPDRDLFFEVIGALVYRASVSWNGLRAFGEMVRLLWKEGNREGAIELEHLWNELARRYPFALFCAYSREAFPTCQDREAFAHVCDAHSLVIL